MADTTVSGDVLGAIDIILGLWGPYWSDESTGVILLIRSGDGDVDAFRTTDKGAAWTRTTVGSGAATHLAAWYDKETPGDTGTLLHITWLDSIGSDACRYNSIDVSDATLGTERVVDSTITLSLTADENRLAITKTVGGNLIVAFSTEAEVECYKSADAFATAGTDIGDVFETATESDWVLLFPANTADNNDVAAIFWDADQSTITVKMWDDSVGTTWTESDLSDNMVPDNNHMNMDGVIRHSDKKLLLAAHNNDDDAGDDIQTWEIAVDSIASPTVTAKTNVVTNQAESAQVAIWINNQVGQGDTDEVRVMYLKGGTWLSTVDAVFHISTDDMGVWGSEQAYSEAAADDFRLCHAGRQVGDDGGRYQPSFHNDDDTEIFVNEVNDVEIAAVSVVAAAAYAYWM